VSSVQAPTGGREPLWRRVIAAPSTSSGRGAAWLAGAAMGVLAAAGGLVALGVPEWSWATRLGLALVALAALGLALGAGGLAVQAIVRGERSVVVLGPLLFGAFCLVFVVGELVAPA